MKKFLYPGVCFLIAAGCATERITYADTLRPWIGQTETRLQQSWGIPHTVYHLTPQTKIVTYLEISGRPRNGDTRPYAGYEVHYAAIETPDFGFPSQSESNDYYCQTTFTITDGIVSNFSFNGDDCVVSTGENIWDF